MWVFVAVLATIAGLGGWCGRAGWMGVARGWSGGTVVAVSG